MGLISHLKKTHKLIQISRILGGWSAPGFKGFASLDPGNSAQSFQELVRMIKNDPVCDSILRKYSATQDTLWDVFHELEIGGAEWVKHLYIPCVAIADPVVLDYLLRVRTRSGRSIGKIVTDIVVGYYTRGEGLVPPPFNHDGHQLALSGESED